MQRNRESRSKCVYGPYHMRIKIPPGYSVAQVMGDLKRKSSLMIFESFPHLRHKFGNRHFWCTGCFFSTVGVNEARSSICTGAGRARQLISIVWWNGPSACLQAAGNNAAAGAETGPSQEGRRVTDPLQGQTRTAPSRGGPGYSPILAGVRFRASMMCRMCIFMALLAPSAFLLTMKSRMS